MSLQLSANSFLQMLSHSGLLSETQLQQVEKRFPVPLRTSTPRAICDWMLKEGTITEWHADKLLQSKFRGFFLGPYKLLNRVARGGMSTIYSAMHKESGEVHALKVLPPARTNTASYLPRLQREAAMTQRLQHPNIVRVFGFYSESDGQDAVHFIAMEFMQGRDLFETVNIDGPLSCRQAADYIRQAANGLAYAHQAGLVHRDIKPGNLFVPEDGILRILDLGLAQDFDSEENLTREFNERVLGTADYLAPEQAADSHTVDRRADLYSLGCSLYFLPTGQPPFTEGTLVQRLVAHQTKSPVPVTQFRPDVPPELVSILNAMMEKNRDQRISSASEVAERISQFLESIADKPEFNLRPPKKADQSRSPEHRVGSLSASAVQAADNSRAGTAETKTTNSADSWPNVVQSSEETSDPDAVVRNEDDKSPDAEDPVGFAKLLATIEAQCGIGGAFEADPRSAELLEVVRRLQRKEPENAGSEQSTEIFPEFLIPEFDQELRRDPEPLGPFGRLLIVVCLLGTAIGLFAILSAWMSSE
jgi:serine/threonine protein kinase